MPKNLTITVTLSTEQLEMITTRLANIEARITTIEAFINGMKKNNTYRKHIGI